MDQFIFTDKAKKLFMAFMVVGVIATIYGAVTDVDRTWVSAMINSWFFFGISLAATFFIGVTQAAQAGWPVAVKRVFEAVSMYLPVGAVLFFIVLASSAAGLNHIYHWMHDGIMDPTSHHYDALIAGKEPFLNKPFWLLRAVIFLGVYILFTIGFRRRSLKQESMPVEKDPRRFRRSLTFAAGFLVFFGYTSMVASWDWLMSIDTHWFSTLYGWYVFSGFWIGGMVVTLMLIIWLKGQGYLEVVNDSHIHDLGKWVFAVSFLWTYLFFSQFMLIWYSDIPEEVVYFMVRIEDYTFSFWAMVLINFVLPMLFLMSRDTKRNQTLLTVIGIIIFFGHWMDAYFLITPGTLKDQGVVGFIELGMLVGFLGLFLFVVFRQLTKAPLVAKNDPLYEESIHHHIH